MSGAIRWDIGDRRTGKTTRLIEESARSGRVIVAATEQMRRVIKEKTSKMGLEIPRPVSFGRARIELLGNHDAKDGVLVDDADMILEHCIGAKVHAAASCGSLANGTEEWLVRAIIGRAAGMVVEHYRGNADAFDRDCAAFEELIRKRGEADLADHLSAFRDERLAFVPMDGDDAE